MSRIYQGGSSDRRYQGRSRGASFQPRQVASNTKEIQQRGQSIINDLKTQDRERQRQDQMDNLETETSNRVAQGNLRIEQQAEASRFKLGQDIERMSMQRLELMENQNLKKVSQEGQNAFNNAQLELKQSLETTQLKSKQAKATEFLSQKQSLQEAQTASSQRLKFAHMEENFILGSKARAQGAQFQVDRAQMQAEHASQNAQLQKQRAGVQALLSFAQLGLKSAEFALDIREDQRREAERQEKIELERMGYDYLISGGASAGDSVEGVVAAQRDQETVEIAEETGFQQAAGGNPITTEQIRQPAADASMDRNIRQASIGEAAQRFGADFDSLINDPNFKVPGPNGPIGLGDIRNASDLQVFLESAARQLTSAYGVSGKDKHSMLVHYGQKVRAAINATYQRIAPTMRSANQQERYDAGLANASQLASGGNFQLAWETARTAAITSGNFMGKSGREINDIVLKDLMSRLPDEQLAELKNVQKIAGNKGSTFGADRYYNDMIDDEITARISDQNRDDSARQSFNNNRVKEVTNNVTRQLFEAETAEEAGQIREAAIAQLLEMDTPEAIDAATKLQGQGNLNNNVYLDLVEGFETGNPPTSAQIADARASGAITHAQMTNLKQRGELGDEIDRRLKATGLPDVKKLVEGITVQAASSMYGYEPSMKGALGPIVADLTQEMETKLRSYLVSNPKATAGDIQQKVGQLQKELYQELVGTGENGRLKIDRETGIEFDYSTDLEPAIPTRRNPVTGKAYRVYSHVDVNQIPKTANPSTDAVLTRDEYLAAAEVWQAGGQDYSLRVKALAQRLGVSPTRLVELQTKALGYPDIQQLDSVSSPTSAPTDLKSGFNALQSMGFPTRGAAYLSGNIMQESSWNGQRSWGEVQGDGSDRNGGLVSWMDGVAHNNFRLTKIEDYLGKSIDQASPSEQLQAMKWEMQRDYTESYRIFMNPNSTDTQLRRASRLYWGYGHEGNRYGYAQSLL